MEFEDFGKGNGMSRCGLKEVSKGPGQRMDQIQVALERPMKMLWKQFW